MINEFHEISVLRLNRNETCFYVDDAWFQHQNSYISQRPVCRERWQIKCHCHKQFSSHSQRSTVDCCYCNFSLRLLSLSHHRHLTLPQFMCLCNEQQHPCDDCWWQHFIFATFFLWNLSSPGKLTTTGEKSLWCKWKKSIREHFNFFERWRSLIQWFRDFS